VQALAAGDSATVGRAKAKLLKQRDQVAAIGRGN